MTLNAHANLFQMVGHLAAFHRPCSFTYAWHHNRQHAREGLPLWLWDAHNRFHDDDDGIHYAYRQTRDTDDYDGGWLHLFISLWNIVIICIVGILEPPPSCLRSGLPVFFSAWSIHGRSHLANRQRCGTSFISFEQCALDPSYIIEHREEEIIYPQKETKLVAATSLVEAVHLKVQAEPTTPWEIVIGQGHLLVRRHGQRGTAKKHDT